MVYQSYTPSKLLSNYVESISYIEGNNKGTGLPKTAMSLVFNLEDSFKLFTDATFLNYIDYKKFWVAGIQTSPTSVESYGQSKMMVVQFKTLGAFVFLQEPLHYYTNAYVPLDCVFKHDANNTWEQLQEANTILEKFLIIEQMLWRRLLRTQHPNPKLSASIDMLLHNNGNLSIHAICQKMNISRKHLNNLSQAYAGVSPKTLSSLSRLQTTLKIIAKSTNEKLTELAYQADFFDQAHFINDFKKHTNMTPKAYAKLAASHLSMQTVPHFIPF